MKLIAYVAPILKVSFYHFPISVLCLIGFFALFSIKKKKGGDNKWTLYGIKSLDGPVWSTEYISIR